MSKLSEWTASPPHKLIKMDAFGDGLKLEFTKHGRLIIWSGNVGHGLEMVHLTNSRAHFLRDFLNEWLDEEGIEEAEVSGGS